LDEHILKDLAIIFGIKVKVRKHNKGFYIMDTNSSRSLENIKKYFRLILISKKYIEYKI
jgi:hypothetical protein